MYGEWLFQWKGFLMHNLMILYRIWGYIENNKVISVLTDTKLNVNNEYSV